MADPYAFDVTGARNAGYTSGEIADYLAQRTGFNVGAAREAGYADDEIVSYLTPKEPEKAPPEAPKEEPGLGTRLKLNVREGFRETLAGETVNRFESGQVAKEEAANLQRAIEEAKAAGSNEALPAFQPTEEEKRRRAANPMLRTPAKPNPFAGMSIEQMEGLKAEATQEAERLEPEYKAMRERQQKELAALPSWTEAPSLPGKIVQGTTALAGQLIGGAASPENLIGGPGRVARQAGEGALAYGARQLGGGAVEGALGAAAANPVVQAGKIERGEQQEFSATEAAENIVLGAGVGAAFRGVGMGVRALRRTPEHDATPVMEAPTVDDAIRTAREIVDTGSARRAAEDTARTVEEGAEYLTPRERADALRDRDQASLNDLWGGLNDGDVVRVGRDYFYAREGQPDIPLQVWEPNMGGEGTVSPALVAAQRRHYDQMGVRVVYFADDKAIPFDGAVDPGQPNTIFLSNKPQRNAAQVGAHEVTHLLERTTLPDGRNLADLLYRQIAEGLTPEGLEYAHGRFMRSAPKRAEFPEGPEGNALHTDAVAQHLIRELGSDIGGEAPKFQTFLPRVLDAVETRYGATTAREVLTKLMDGIRSAIQTVRQFFSQPHEMAEYGGPPETVSQRWVSNLEAVHGTLAEMYAARYGEAQGFRDRIVGTNALPAPALVTPPPRPAITPENVFRPETYAGPPRIETAPLGAPVAPVGDVRRETIRFYTGGDRSADGRQPWLTADLQEARAAADRNGEPVRFVDLPASSPLIQRAWDGDQTAPVMAMGAPPRVAAQFRDLEPAIGAKPGRPLVPDATTIEESLAAHEKVRRDTMRAETPTVEVPPDFKPSREEMAQATRLSKEWDPQQKLKERAEPYPFTQPEHDRAMRDYLSDIGVETRGMQPRQIAWIIRQDPEIARTMSLGRLVHQLGENDSAELAYRLDAEIARAQAESRPEPGSWDLGDHRDLEAPTRQELEAVYADYERAAGLDGARPAEAGEASVRPAETAGAPEAGPAAAGEPAPVGQGADRPAQEVPAVEPAQAAGAGEAEQAVARISRRILDEADRVGVRADLERFAAGGEPTPEVMDVIRRARGQVVDPVQDVNATLPEEPVFSPRERRAEPSISPRDDRAPLDFSPREPRIYGERREAAPYTPEQRQTLENIGLAETPGATLREQAMAAARDPAGTVDAGVEWAKDKAKGFAKAVVDPYVALRELGDVPYKMARLANDSSGAIKTFLEHGKIKFAEGAGYTADKDTGGVVWEVIMPLRNPTTGKTEANRFIRWMAGGRAEMLRAEGRENLITKQDELNLKALAQGTLDFDYQLRDGTTTRSREAAFKDTQAKYNEYNKNVLDIVHQAGVIDKTLYDKLKANPWYVSFLRVDETDGTVTEPSGREGLTKQNLIRKLRGGSEKLNADLWGSTMATWGRMIDGALKNKTGTEILGFMEQAKGARPIKEQAYHNMTNAEKASTTWVMKGGKRVYYEVDDPGMRAALEGFRSTEPLGKLGEWMGAFRKVFQYSIMANPVAQLTVMVKDQIHTPAVTGVGWNIPRNFYRGVSNLDTMTPLDNMARAIAGRQLKRQQMGADELRLLAGGGLMSRSTGTDTGTAPTRMSAYLNTPGALDTVMGYLSRLDTAYQQVTTIGEGISRMAVYREMRRQGVPEWLAVYEAKDVQDYSLRPGNPYVRGFVNMLPFANVHNIGLYKLFRPKSVASLAMGFAAMTALKVANDWYYKDDEEFQKRPERDHNSSFWLKLGPWGFDIPIGFEVGALSAMSANFITAMFDPEMTLARAGRNAGKIAWDQLAMNPIPQAGRPIFESVVNRQGGFFSDRPIENMTDRRLDPDQRYNAETTLAARGISGMFSALGVGISPKEIDHMVRQYTGWLGVQSMALADSAMRSISNEPERAEISVGRALSKGDIWGAISRGSFGPETATQSRYVDMLYQQGEKIEHAYNTYKELIARGRTGEAEQYAQDNQEELGKYRQFSRVKEVESKLNRQIRMVENDPEMTGAQKKLAIARLSAQKNEAARSVFVP